MTIELFARIVYIGMFLSVCIVLMSFFRFNQRSTESRLVGLIYLLSLCTYMSMSILALKGKDVNIPQTIHKISMVIALTVMYNVALGKRYKGYLTVVGAGFLLFAVPNLFLWEKNDISTNTLILSSFIILVYSIIYLYRLLVDLPVEKLHRVPMFWFNAAFLIMNAGTLFLFLFTSYLVKVLNNQLLIYWTFHNILSIVQQLVIMIGLWQDLRNIKLRSSSLSAR
jgi:hypothetical protein